MGVSGSWNLVGMEPKCWRHADGLKLKMAGRRDNILEVELYPKKSGHRIIISDS